MSDIIPPLISSTPPPMPEFDDEEDDDDDDDFGMGTGISDLGIDFQDTTLRETKDKGLELERNGRVGGSQDGWRSNEEQDSASQDSGLCMASHGSEGVSPLPQSDDDERATEMRHSATVIFDDKPQPHPTATNGITSNDDEDRSDDEFGNWTVADNFTQQTEDNHSCNTQSDKISQPPKQTKDIETCNGSIPNGLLNHSANDEQFESANISKTAPNDIQSLNYRCVETTNDIQSVEDRCVETINDTHSNGLKEDVSTKSVCGNASNDIQSLDHRCVETTNEIHPNDLKEDMSTKSVAGRCVDNVHLNGSLVDDTTVSVDNNCVDSVIESNLETSDENNHCADGTHSQTQFNCVDDLSDSDDFGNFESVTIVNHNLNCVDSVEKQVETNSQAVDDDSFGDFSEFSEPVIVDSKLNGNEISVNDVRVVETTEEGPSLESNLDSSKSVSLDNSVCQRSSENSTEDPIKCEESHHPDVSGENDDDEFNDFSDFTQSQAVENTADDDEFDEFSDFTLSQAVEGGVDQVKADSVDCGSHTISSQGGFEDIFPREGAETDDAKTEDLEKGAIWQQLCPLESSPALRFQWPNSRAHTKLLSALNIDSRNILFGPKWNAKIPRFAANLGSNPLQPVKASERSSANAPTPTNNLPSEMTLQNEPETVPDAHFDWGSSGLTNPLDCGSHSALLDLEILSTFDSLPSDNINKRNAHRTTAHKSEETVDNNSSKRRNKLDNLKVLSGEAEKIISQLPDLNFMKKTYIEVLISKV